VFDFNLLNNYNQRWPTSRTAAGSACAERACSPFAPIAETSGFSAGVGSLHRPAAAGQSVVYGLRAFDFKFSWLVPKFKGQKTCLSKPWENLGVLAYKRLQFSPTATYRQKQCSAAILRWTGPGSLNGPKYQVRPRPGQRGRAVGDRFVLAWGRAPQA